MAELPPAYTLPPLVRRPKSAILKTDKARWRALAEDLNEHVPVDVRRVESAGSMSIRQSFHKSRSGAKVRIEAELRGLDEADRRAIAEADAAELRDLTQAELDELEDLDGEPGDEEELLLVDDDGNDRPDDGDEQPDEEVEQPAAPPRRRRSVQADAAAAPAAAAAAHDAGRVDWDDKYWCTVKDCDHDYGYSKRDSKWMRNHMMARHFAPAGILHERFAELFKEWLLLPAETELVVPAQ